MTGAEIVTALFVITAAWAAIILERLHDCRKERAMYRADAAHNREVAEARGMTIDRLAKNLIAAHVAVAEADQRATAAEALAADMADQRNDMQRRLGWATRPVGGGVDA